MAIKLALIGASGRSGNQVVQVLPDFPNFELSAAVVFAKSAVAGLVCLTKRSNVQQEVRYSDDLAAALKGSQAVIDFSTAENSLTVVCACAEAGLPVLIAATGHKPADIEKIKGFSGRCAILVAANTSLGVLALHEISAMAKNILGPSYDIEIFEAHHRNKKDAPSGTALSLAKRLDMPADAAAKGSIASLRGGDIPGEHTVYFLGEGERLELTHRVRDRSIFARGALSLMAKLAEKPHGFYAVSDLIKI